jgi:RHS repeat-associated protein
LTAADTTGSWSYNQNNELGGYDDVSYEYDANGNMIQKTVGGVVTKFFYNLEDRLERVEDGVGNVIATYYYDPFGRRLWKEVSGVSTYFGYSDEGLVAELDAAGNVAKSYGYRPGSTWTTDPLFMKIGTEYYFYHKDHLGTPQKMTAVNGAVVWSAKYNSSGEADVDASSTITNNLRFPGQIYEEETGLHYNYHRYYDPKLGRYLRSDPIGLAGGINLFSYVQNNPIKYNDASGLWSERNHDRIIVEGLKNYGLSSGQIKIVVEANNWFDLEYQDDKYSYYHSMRAPGQPLETAKKLRDQFKLEILKKIRESRVNRKCAGDDRIWSDEELKYFGYLQHPYVDETNPGHAWKEWNITPWKYNPIYFINNSLYPYTHWDQDKEITPELLNKNAQIVRGLFKEAIE